MHAEAMTFLLVGTCKIGIYLYGIFEKGIRVHLSTGMREQFS